MPKERTPDAERFCRYCGAWIGGMDLPKYLGLVCRKCFYARKIQTARDKRNGTWVRQRTSKSSTSEPKMDERLAIAAAHKRTTCGGEIMRSLFKGVDHEQSE